MMRALSRTSSSEMVSGGEMRKAVSQKRNQSLMMPACLKSSMMRYNRSEEPSSTASFPHDVDIIKY